MPIIDEETGIRRCGNNRTLYVRFLLCFCEDSTFLSLNSAIAAGDSAAAFRHAHTLKGLAAQLGLMDLSIHAAALCDILRAASGHIPMDTYEALDAVSLCYHATLHHIHEQADMPSTY
ncbi:MAG: Hpt domain-containing protein [Clostridia bacterium]|nr:Hpt domain-containing protein [Clostridia bacterium]